jgi:hypothetical protein
VMRKDGTPGTWMTADAPQVGIGASSVQDALAHSTIRRSIARRLCLAAVEL